jgi:hypothetical protein
MGAKPSAAKETRLPIPMLYLDRCLPAAKLALYREAPANGGQQAPRAAAAH